MTTWVLIVLLHGDYVGFQEFTSEARCEQAKIVFTTAKAVCVPK